MKKENESSKRILASADKLFYAEGIQAVGIDRITKEANVALNTFYKHYKSKDDLILQYLTARDKLWLDQLATYIDNQTSKLGVINGIFDMLDDWFNSPNYNGCAFVNATGEFGINNYDILRVSKKHKNNVKKLIETKLNSIDSYNNDFIVLNVIMLIEGAISVSHVFGYNNIVDLARANAITLLEN